MWVIKIGGSLHDAPELPHWLDAVASHAAGRAILVAGGGPFADQVRAAQARWKFNDTDAHRMAVHAMEQYARVFIAMEPRLLPATNPAEIEKVLAGGRVPVWFPARMVERQRGIEPVWDFTSDSLAAWLAGHIGARDLALVKSVTPLAGIHPASKLAADGIVDRCFPDLLGVGKFAAWWLGRSDYRVVSGFACGSRPAAQLCSG